MGNSPEVRDIVAALTPKVERCTQRLRAQEVGNALFGLRGLRDSPEARALVTGDTAVQDPFRGSKIVIFHVFG